jgi:hypothetical protein
MTAGRSGEIVEKRKARPRTSNLSPQALESGAELTKARTVNTRRRRRIFPPETLTKSDVLTRGTPPRIGATRRNREEITPRSRRCQARPTKSIKSPNFNYPPLPPRLTATSGRGGVGHVAGSSAEPAPAGEAWRSTAFPQGSTELTVGARTGLQRRRILDYTPI